MYHELSNSEAGLVRHLLWQKLRSRVEDGSVLTREIIDLLEKLEIPTRSGPELDQKTHEVDPAKMQSTEFRGRRARQPGTQPQQPSHRSEASGSAEGHSQQSPSSGEIPLKEVMKSYEEDKQLACRVRIGGVWRNNASLREYAVRDEKDGEVVIQSLDGITDKASTSELRKRFTEIV